VLYTTPSCASFVTDALFANEDVGGVCLTQDPSRMPADRQEFAMAQSTASRVPVLVLDDADVAVAVGIARTVLENRGVIPNAEADSPVAGFGVRFFVQMNVYEQLAEALAKVCAANGRVEVSKSDQDRLASYLKADARGPRQHGIEVRSGGALTNEDGKYFVESTLLTECTMENKVVVDDVAGLPVLQLVRFKKLDDGVEMARRVSAKHGALAVGIVSTAESSVDAVAAWGVEGGLAATVSEIWENEKIFEVFTALERGLQFADDFRTACLSSFRAVTRRARSKPTVVESEEETADKKGKKKGKDKKKGDKAKGA